MQEDEPITEEDLEREFRDDPEFAFEMLDAYFREPLLRYIKSCARGLSSEDLADVYQEALMEMVTVVRSGRFNPEKPLRLIQTIAKRRAIDLARKKKVRTCTELDLAFIAEDLKDSDIGLEWRLLGPDGQRRFRRALGAAIDSLPPKQQAAALAFLDVYEEIRRERSYRVLKERIEEMTGEDVTTSQAKSNWHEAKKKLVEKIGRIPEFRFLGRDS
jgi:RNA polymerase sigma factor (sigma-70 family)